LQRAEELGSSFKKNLTDQIPKNSVPFLNLFFLKEEPSFLGSLERKAYTLKDVAFLS
jgi:hypothetical protein